MDVFPKASNKWRRLRILMGPCLTVFFLTLTRTMGDNDKAAAGGAPDYALMTSNSYILVDVIAAWTKTSLMQCVRNCKSEASCEGFLWNSREDMKCSIGRGVGKVSGARADNSVRLYAASDKCRFDLGFEVWSDGTNRLCLYVSKDEVNFTQAKGVCSSLGGRLVKTNTQELIGLVAEAAARNGVIEYVFIGLDDINTEGMYVWSDGKTMTATETSLFDVEPKQPTGGAEDCGLMRLPSRALHDSYCWQDRSYVCETNY